MPFKIKVFLLTAMPFIASLPAQGCGIALHSRYSMTYAGNQLSRMEIEREGEDYEGRTGAGATGTITGFWYDMNGNLGQDMSRGIMSTRYNRLNLPTDVYFLNGHRQTITYDGFGQKRQVSYSQTDDPMLGAMMGVPEDSAYTLQGRRSYLGPHVFVNDSLEYSAFPGGYFTPEGTYYYITDWQGNNIAVFSDKGRPAQQTTYYPYGEPTVEPAGQRYLFGGKEREHAGGSNSSDFGPRCLTPTGSWSAADRMSESFYPLSPFSYCGGDPINRVDRDGNIPLPVILALSGAVTDFVTQISVNMVKGDSFWQAIGNVDVTSVLTSAATSAILGPIGSKSVKIGVSAVTSAADAAVDININGDIVYVGGDGECEKTVAESCIDFGASFLPGIVKHSPVSSSTLRYSTPEAIGKDWTEQEMNNATKIMSNISAEATKKGIENAKKDQKNNRQQYIEPTDAIQVRPESIYVPITNF